MRFILLLIILTASPLLAVAQQSDETCQKQLEYLFNLSSQQPKVSMRGTQGRAVNAFDEPIFGLCVLLVTEDEQTFVAQTTTDKNGYFRFGKTPKGEYRLLSRVQNLDGACPINLRVKQKSNPSDGLRKSKQLVLHLRVAGINDVDCSYAESEQKQVPE